MRRVKAMTFCVPTTLVRRPLSRVGLKVTFPAELMTTFYEELSRVKAPAAALRNAQVKLLKQRPHPFFWSPFVVVGRW